MTHYRYEHDPAEKTCTVSGCEKKLAACGYCHMHYWRVRVKGDANYERAPGTKVAPHIKKNGHIVNNDKARFFSKIEYKENSECWLWKSSINNDGYGRFWLDGTTAIAHRYSYELHKGPIPNDLQIDHLCSVRRCVNPEHLEAVTAKENNRRSKNFMRSRDECKNGHKLTKENIYLYLNARYCRACRRKMSKDYWNRHKKGSEYVVL